MYSPPYHSSLLELKVSSFSTASAHNLPSPAPFCFFYLSVPAHSTQQVKLPHTFLIPSFIPATPCQTYSPSDKDLHSYFVIHIEMCFSYRSRVNAPSFTMTNNSSDPLSSATYTLSQYFLLSHASYQTRINA